MSLNDKGFPEAFEHPSAGRSELEARWLAVRWRPGGSDEAKQALIEEVGLVPATVGDDERRPSLAVNRTDGLWWVQDAQGEAIGDQAIEQLEASELVEWVSPAYRTSRTPGAEPSATAPEGAAAAVFAINPTRLYVRRQAIDAAGGAEALADVDTDTGRASRMSGYTPLRVQTGTAITAARRLAATLEERSGTSAGAVRFETIPFISPALPAAAVRGNCRPPTGELVPDDPLFGQQWGLQRTEVPRAWQIVRGSHDVVIAVLDEGVELGHPDLDLYPQSWNASDDLPDGSPTGNHGTACAGIAAARMDNGLGVAG